MTTTRVWTMVTLAALGLWRGMALAGSLNAPADPNDQVSAMFTLNDIYNVLDTRTTNVTLSTSFAEPTGAPTGGTMRTLNDIMALVTNRAPVPKTGCTNSTAFGDDGMNRIGVAWPKPRFTVVGALGTAATNQIRDNLTGLIWAMNANLASNTSWSTTGKVSWISALDVITNSTSGVVNRLNYGGTNDWRLPNVRELFSLIDFSMTGPALPANHPFVNVQCSDASLDHYWTSTVRPDNTGFAYRVHFAQGTALTPTAKATLYYVWPVRGGR